MNDADNIQQNNRPGDVAGIRARVHEMLRLKGPQKPAALLRLVLQTRKTPQALADRLVATWLEGDERFEKDGKLWRLSRTHNDSPRLSDVSFTVVDFETTGCNPMRDRIIEIGACRVTGGKVTSRYATLINPGMEVPGMITALTGINTAMLVDAPPMAEVAPTFMEFLEGNVFVAHSARFDFGFLNGELRRLGREPLADRPVCTVQLTRRMFPGLGSYSLGNVVVHFDIPLDDAGRHRAPSDSWATAELLIRCVGEMERYGIDTFGALERLLHTPPRRVQQLLQTNPEWFVE